MTGEKHAAEKQITARLNQVCRRLREYENEGQWLAALRDGVSLGAQSFAIFGLNNGCLQLRAQHGLDLADAVEFPVAAANGFAAAIAGRDPVITMRTPGEIGMLLSSNASTARAHLFPIVNADRVVAVVFAVSEEALDTNVVELVAGAAGTALERPSNRSLHAQIAPAAAAPKTATIRERTLPKWADLRKEERVLHVQARRFARVAIAQMQLRRPEAGRAGREKENLYLLLREEIDKARESYARQFMTVSSMVDYLHRELVETAAGHDERKLGAEYPGQLV